MRKLSPLASLLALGAVAVALSAFALGASAGESTPPECDPAAAPCEVPGTVPVCEGTICEAEPFPCDPDAEVCAFEECDPETQECDVPLDSGGGDGCDPATGECDDLVPPCPPEAEVCILEFGPAPSFEGASDPVLTNPFSEISESFPVSPPSFANGTEATDQEASTAGTSPDGGGPAVDTGDSGAAEGAESATAMQLAMVAALAALTVGTGAIAYRRLR